MLVFFKGGVGRESVFTPNTYILYTTLNFLQEGLIYLFPNIHCHLSKCTVYKKKEKKESTFLVSQHDLEKHDHTWALGPMSDRFLHIEST